MAADPQRIDADNHIREAINALEAAQLRHLDHTDSATVQAALGGLAIVQRSVTDAAITDSARVAARLGQLAVAVKSCADANVSLAYAELKSAAAIFEAMAESAVNSSR